MDAFVIQGGARLHGRVRVNGAKNATLPQMAAALLTDETVTLRDAPNLSDIERMGELLAELGCDIRREADPSRPDGRAGSLHLCTLREESAHARYDIVRTMRASICVLGPLLARRGEARISMPGGCVIGQRPIDLHLRGLQSLGASIDLESGDVRAKAPMAPGGERRLRGARVFLGGPFGSTVLGTANVMCAAALAKGETLIECAACEPEVADLAALLVAMGAKIEGAGTPRIHIEGADTLSGAEHRVIADRIEAGTLMCAAAVTRGDVTLENCPVDALTAFIDRLEAAGVSVDHGAAPSDWMRADCRVRMNAERPEPIQVTTQPHPGFPTDLQAQLMALLCVADGHSVVTEKIFPERFLHVAELSRMGAQVFRQGPTAVVSGQPRLVGAPVMASDIRASAGLVVAGLAAHGETRISRVYHLDRGYERLETALTSIGADIRREREDATARVNVELSAMV